MNSDVNFVFEKFEFDKNKEEKSKILILICNNKLL